VNKAVCCPDALIRCFPQNDWYTQERWQETVALHEGLSPKITCVIGQAPGDEKYKPDERIQIIDAGFEYLKLENIVNELIFPFKAVKGAEEKRGNGSLWLKWLKRLSSHFVPKALAKRYL
jgi:hypothetical protein